MQVGVGVFVIKHSQYVLIGKRGPGSRRNAGVWALPGGMVEDGETIEQCIRREIFEETGLQVYPFTECIWYMDYVIGVSRGDTNMTLWCAVQYNGGTPIAKEPNKCDAWLWMEPREIFNMIDDTPEQREWIDRHAWIKMLYRCGIPFNKLI